MNVTSNVVTTTKLESVTITLTPREAFLLTTLFGNLERGELKELINKSKLNEIVSYAEKPSFDIYKNLVHVIGNCTNNEDDDIRNMYYSLIKIFG